MNYDQPCEGVCVCVCVWRWTDSVGQCRQHIVIIIIITLWRIRCHHWRSGLIQCHTVRHQAAPLACLQVTWSASARLRHHWPLLSTRLSRYEYTIIQGEPKIKPPSSCHSCVKYWQIFTILSLTQSTVIFSKTNIKDLATLQTYRLV